MRADALDLSIGEHQLRVVLPDGGSLAILADAFRDYLMDEPAPPAFRVKPPDGQGDFYVLLDRSGFILARSRTSEGCMAVLGGILAGLEPVPAGSVRLPLRAVANDEGVVLASFPLFRVPALIERRLERIGYRIVDGLMVDIDQDLLLSRSAPKWAGSQAPQLPPGHCDDKIDRSEVSAVLMPRVGSVAPTRAQSIAFLAAGDPSFRNQSLDVAERLADRARNVPVTRSGEPIPDIYALLKTLRRV